MHAHLTKPVEPEHLFKILGELIWETENRNVYFKCSIDECILAGSFAADPTGADEFILRLLRDSFLHGA
jgi:hypothetical protein